MPDNSDELALAAAAAGAGSTPQAGYGASPPGGMGVTSQGFGQEGYVLNEDAMVQPKPPEEAENFSVGVPYYLPYSTPYRDSWEVFRTDPVSIQQLITMRRQSGQARALYRLLTMPILAALKGAKIVQDPDVKGGQAEQEFIQHMYFDPPSSGGMEYSVKRLVRQMLLALFDGFWAGEMIYWTPDTGANKGKWTLRSVDWRPAETLTHLLDGQGRHNGFRQRTFFQGRTIDVKIPKDTAVYWANEEAERPFYGVSMFEAAFYHWDNIVKLLYITHLAAQRKAVGMRIGTMAPNPHANDKNNFVKGLQELGLAAYMVVPTADWTVTVLNDSGTGFDFLGLINWHMNQMSKSVLAPWFDNNQGSGSGETSLVDFGQQSDATFLMMLESVMDDMAGVFDNVITPRFIDWNFGSGKYPKWKWGQLTAEQKAAIQTIFTQLAAVPQGGNVTPDFMLQLEQKLAEDLGLDIDYDKIRKQRADQQKQMAQQGYDPSQMGALTQFGQQPSPEFAQQQQEQQLQMQQQYGQNGNGQGQQDQGEPAQSRIDPSLMPAAFQSLKASATGAGIAYGMGALRQSAGQFLDSLIALSGGAP